MGSVERQDGLGGRAEKIGDRAQSITRLFKKAADLTRPTPARRDAPLHGRGRSEVHAMPNKAWHACGRLRDGEGPCPVSTQLRSRVVIFSERCENAAGRLFQCPVRRRDEVGAPVQWRPEDSARA